MRFRGFAFAAVVLAAGVAWGAAGDALVVTGNGVNVRYGPEPGAGVKMQLYRNHQVIELERQGDWVRGEIAGTGGEEGWIHSSLLAPIDGEPTTPPAAAPQAPAAPATSPPAARAEPSPAPEDTAPPQAEAPAPDAPEPLPATAGRDPGPTGGATVPEPAAGPAAAELGGLQRFRESVEYLNTRALEVAGVDLFTDVEPAGGGTVQVGTTPAWSTVPPAGQRSYLNTLVDRWAAASGGTDRVSVQIVDPQGKVVAEQSSP